MTDPPVFDAQQELDKHQAVFIVALGEIGCILQATVLLLAIVSHLVVSTALYMQRAHGVSIDTYLDALAMDVRANATPLSRMPTSKTAH